MYVSLQIYFSCNREMNTQHCKYIAMNTDLSLCPSQFLYVRFRTNSYLGLIPVVLRHEEPHDAEHREQIIIK